MLRNVFTWNTFTKKTLPEVQIVCEANNYPYVSATCREFLYGYGASQWSDIDLAPYNLQSQNNSRTSYTQWRQKKQNKFLQCPVAAFFCHIHLGIFYLSLPAPASLPRSPQSPSSPRVLVSLGRVQHTLSRWLVTSHFSFVCNNRPRTWYHCDCTAYAQSCGTVFEFDARLIYSNIAIG